MLEFLNQLKKPIKIIKQKLHINILIFMESIDIFEQYLQTYLSFLNVDRDKAKLVFYFIACIPLSMVLRFIKIPSLRYTYNLGLGLIFFIFFSKEWSLYIFGNAMIIYFLVMFLGRKCFWIVFVTSFSALSYCHIYRLLYDYLSWNMDFNAVQMMMTCRQIYYAKQFTTTNILHYLSYLFMFPHMIIGPIPYKDFQDFMQLKGSYQDIPLTFAPMVKTLLHALLFVIGDVIVKPLLDIDVIFSDAWQSYGLVKKHFVLHFIGLFLRFKYFAAFKLTQVSIDASGISYDSEKEKFAKFETASYKYEIEPNCIVKTNHWNCLVQNWLKTCVYESVAPSLGQSKAFLLTFVASALWHGFYLTYYFFFFWWAMINFICKYAYKTRSKFEKIPYSVKYVVGFTFVSLTMNQAAMAVAFLDWDLAMRFQADLQWSGQVLVLIAFAFFYALSASTKSKKP